MRRLIYSPNGWLDYIYWQKTDKRVVSNIDEITKEICKTPFEGIGKPHPLKFELANIWTRRISMEHRIVYRATDEVVEVIQCRYHY